MSSAQTITMTQAAARKVYQLMQEENNLALNLRVYITGGGCSGFQYGFTFEETIDPEEDTVITTYVESETPVDENTPPEVRLVVNYASLNYLRGAEIDYTKGMEGEQFIIRNPKAKTTCGCGSSFSVDEEE